MHYKFLTVLFLCTSGFLRAGPVPSDRLFDGHFTEIEGQSTGIVSKALLARAEETEGSDANCKDWNTCKIEGRKNWDRLKEKLDADNPQEVTEYDDVFERDYIDGVTKDSTPEDAAFREVFENLHLDFHKHFATHVVASKDEKTESGSGHATYQNMYNTNQGTMIGMWNFKEYDTKNTMPFSEAFFQCFRKECDEAEELKKLQFLGVQNVINEVYLQVVLDIYRENKVKTLYSEYKKWTYEDNQDEFLGLLGTPKLGFLLKMLRDHPVRIGKKIPVEIYTNHRLRSLYILIKEYEG
ncbi:MAG: hypothetical protein Q9213_002210 [Squamulea squamosa]